MTAHINLMNTFEELSLKNLLDINKSSVGVTAGYKSPFGQIKMNYSIPLQSEKGIFSVILGHWF